jgi:hypothetical protein
MHERRKHTGVRVGSFAGIASIHQRLDSHLSPLEIADDHR